MYNTTAVFFVNISISILFIKHYIFSITKIYNIYIALLDKIIDLPIFIFIYLIEKINLIRYIH